MTQTTLLRQGSPLAEPLYQLQLLNPQNPAPPSFAKTLHAHGLGPLHATGVEVLQVNLGKLCNQTCRHCHVDAGPERREIMSRPVAEAVGDGRSSRASIATAARPVPVPVAKGGWLDEPRLMCVAPRIVATLTL